MTDASTIVPAPIEPNQAIVPETWFRNEARRSGVQGMLTPFGAAALAALIETQQSAKVSGSLVEIGCFHGLCTIGFALSSKPGERVIGVDVFRTGSGPFKDTFNANLSSALDVDVLKRISILEANSHAIQPSAWVNLVRPLARLIHIDGGHDRLSVLNDLSLSRLVLAEAGVIVFDDIFHEWFPGVTEGIVDGLRAAPELVPIAIIPRGGSTKGGNKLVCCKRGWTDVYAKALDQALPRDWRTTQSWLGHDILVWQR